MRYLLWIAVLCAATCTACTTALRKPDAASQAWTRADNWSESMLNRR